MVKWAVVKEKHDFIMNLLIENYDDHEKVFEGNNRDFTDSLLISKKEAEEEDKDVKKYLDKWNIINSTFELVSDEITTVESKMFGPPKLINIS